MCCFSRRVKHVEQTEIFARQLPNGRQALIYSMRINAAEDLAMILPIPVLQPAAENAVQFVDLHEYPELFAGLRRAFYLPRRAASGRSPTAAAAPLKVVAVGGFNASFVPTIRDFSRLDPQFRLPEGVWERLGDYARYGFAVFKLRKGEARIHPMAFTFPSARRNELFFPTVHIHDGTVHPEAHFDHALFCQAGSGATHSLLAWEASQLPAGKFVNATAARGLIAPEAHLHRKVMAGEHPNRDVWLRVA